MQITTPPQPHFKKKLYYLINIDNSKHDSLNGMKLLFQGPQGMQGIRGGPGDSGQPVSIITQMKNSEKYCCFIFGIE